MTQMRRVGAEELAGLLRLYTTLDDLAQDLSSGVDHHNYLPELWGTIKALGEPLDGLKGYDAYALPPQAPIVVIESDATIMPYEDWSQLNNWGSNAV